MDSAITEIKHITTYIRIGKLVNGSSMMVRLLIGTETENKFSSGKTELTIANLLP